MSIVQDSSVKFNSLLADLLVLEEKTKALSSVESQAEFNVYHLQTNLKYLEEELQELEEELQANKMEVEESQCYVDNWGDNDSKKELDLSKSLFQNTLRLIEVVKADIESNKFELQISITELEKARIEHDELQNATEEIRQKIKDFELELENSQESKYQ